jgi:hypothetical protein
MFESAEIGHRIDRATYKAEVPALRAALLQAQYAFSQQAERAIVVLINPDNPLAVRRGLEAD